MFKEFEDLALGGAENPATPTTRGCRQCLSAIPVATGRRARGAAKGKVA